MKITTEVNGVLDFEDDKLKTMTDIVNNHKKLGLPRTEEVEEYFDKLGVPSGWVPNSDDDYKVLVTIPSREYAEAFEQGIEIDVASIPNEVKTLKIKIKV